jgi:GPH family glycoside/pentoside/hexuronide:cation symporter
MQNPASTSARRLGLAFGFGNMGLNIMTMLVTMWIYRRYCPPDSASAALLDIGTVSMLLFGLKIVESFTGFTVGHWSDHTRTRWGRRMPFIAAGALPLGLSFLVLWLPPLRWLPAQSTGLYVFFTLSAAVFWIAFVTVQIPLFSLLPELAVTSEARIALATYQTAFTLLSTGLVMIGVPFLLHSFGFPLVGVLFTGLAMVCLLSLPLTVRETFCGALDPAASMPGFAASFTEAVRNRSFIIYLVSKVFAQIGFQIVIMTIPYVVPTIIGRGDKFVGVLLAGTAAAAALTFRPMRRYAVARGKKAGQGAALLALGFLLPCVFLFGRLDLSLNVNIAGAHVFVPEAWMSAGLFFLLGFPIATLMILQAPLMGDIIDQDEVNTGLRREALYFGINGVAMKIGIGLSTLLMGALFHTFGYTVGHHLGVDLCALCAGFLVLIGYIILRFYPIDKQMEDHIRSTLDARRAVI